MRTGIVMLALAATSFGSVAQDTFGQGQAPSATARTAGVLVHDRRACPGYTLLAPLTSKDTYLIDMEGRVVHTWRSDWQPALSAYLLENGSLLRAGALPPDEKPFGGPGAGGRIQKFTWDGELVWDYKFPVDRLLPHHDIYPMPNGNVLVVAWDRRTADEAIAAGRRKELISSGQVLSDSILEIKPTGKTTGEIVWQWNVWDHLIQDHDKTKANYGDVAAHPELIDLNVHERMFGGLIVRSEESDLLKAAGIAVGPGRGLTDEPAGVPDRTADWTHANSVAYNAELDQIMVSVRSFCEFWVIDHSTTTAEAAGHTGGRYGKGGDLLYRWGNPRVYRAGTQADQRLFKQHHAHWIPQGHPGAGRILLFNNGNNRPDGSYSTADEIALPVNADGHYPLVPSQAPQPDQPAWSYAAPKKTDLFSMVVGGVQRLPNGNTLICPGASGTLIEVTAKKEEVWRFVNPLKGSFAGYGPNRPRRVGRGGLPTVNNSLFRAYRYTPDYAGLADKELKAGKLLEEPVPETRTE
jgi:hypothetical protein